MMMSGADLIKMFFKEHYKDVKIEDNRAFKTFNFNPRCSDEQLTTLGIDGVVSDIITVTALRKMLKKMGLDLEKDGEVLEEDHILYSNLKTQFEFQKNFYVGKKNKTVFMKVPLLDYTHSESLRDCLFVVFNSRELRDRCVKSKKSWNYYCKISLQGLHQPTREVRGKMMECLHYFFKGIKLGELDVAVDVKKQGKLIDHVQKIKDTMSESLSTDIKVTTPKFVANVEESCYFNVLDKTHPIKNIKFYNKHKKQTQKYEDEIDNDYKSWHRIEITLRNLKSKYSKCADKILLCVAEFIEIIKKSDIMPKVGIDMNNQDLFKAQLRAVKDLDFAKKLRISYDAELFVYDIRRNARVGNRINLEHEEYFVVNEIIPSGNKRTSYG